MLMVCTAQAFSGCGCHEVADNKTDRMKYPAKAWNFTRRKADPGVKGNTLLESCIRRDCDSRLPQK